LSGKNPEKPSYTEDEKILKTQQKKRVKVAEKMEKTST